MCVFLQFFEYSTDGELRYNTRTPAGCVVGDGISTYLTIQLCRGHGKPIPADQKFVFREVRSARVCLLQFGALLSRDVAPPSGLHLCFSCVSLGRKPVPRSEPKVHPGERAHR